MFPWTSLSAVTSFLRSAFTRLPPVARRDERIARLQRRVKKLEKVREAMVTRPSYQVRVNEERRLRRLEEEIGAPSRSVIAGGKFHVYDLVSSHGIDVPEQLGRWDDPADIPWDDLPDAVVIKSAFGAASRGVLPLRRVDGGWRVATDDRTLRGTEIAADLASLLADGTIRPPLGAEEFLDDGSGSTPVDTKVYAFYGETPIALVRQVDRHGPGGSARFRVVDVHGTDQLDTYRGQPTDPSIPLSAALGDIFDAARRVSLAIRAPFSRIDFYDIRGRIVFGEVTPRPGAAQWFGPDLDVRLGEAWERAQVRLWRDLANGMSPDPEWGPRGRPTT